MGEKKLLCLGELPVSIPCPRPLICQSYQLLQDSRDDMDSDWEVEQDAGEYDLQDPSWWEDQSDGAL